MEWNNKIIAKFMDCTNPFNDLTDATLYKVSHGTFEAHELKYHTDWNWLMPVIDKCYQEHMSKHIADAVMTCDIGKAYRVIAEFIKENNQNN
jgi:hypothetical protein